MNPMKCPHCGGHYLVRREPFPFATLCCGQLVLPDAEFDKCNCCGDILLPPGTARRMGEFESTATAALVAALPAGDFVTAKAAAAIVGVSIQAFHKHRRIQRGFIHQINMEGHKLYHRQSVRLFKKTGDGRFPLAPVTECESAPQCVVSWGSPHMERYMPEQQGTVTLEIREDSYACA